MNKLLTVLLLLSGSTVAKAVPVVPNFTQGSMTSHTETTSNVTETMNSVDYRTGWEYTVTGSGISNNGERLNPTVNTSTVQVNPTADGTGEVTGAVTSSFDSLDFSNPNSFTITNPGGSFQFTLFIAMIRLRSIFLEAYEDQMRGGLADKISPKQFDQEALMSYSVSISIRTSSSSPSS